MKRFLIRQKKEFSQDKIQAVLIKILMVLRP